VKIYIPSIDKMTNDFPINFEVVAQISTNLKLNPIGLPPECPSYITNKEKEELHFIKLETHVKNSTI
jgi:hypothetical protein